MTSLTNYQSKHAINRGYLINVLNVIKYSCKTGELGKQNTYRGYYLVKGLNGKTKRKE